MNRNCEGSVTCETMERLYVQGKQNSLIKVKDENRSNDVKVEDCDVKTEEVQHSDTTDCNEVITKLQNQAVLVHLDNSNETAEQLKAEVRNSHSDILDEKYLDLNNAEKRTIWILTKQGLEKNVTIITINLGWKKQWCGGYRNVRTKKIYWNAFSQTIVRSNGQIIPWPKQEKLAVTRETQTYLDEISRGVNTGPVKGTQTPLRYEESFQSLIVPFKYTSREEVERKRNRVKNAILILQKWMKRHLAMKNYRRLKKMEEKCKAIEERRKKEAEKVAEIQSTLQLYVKPSVNSKSELYNLEREVIKWREREVARIMQVQSGPCKYAALYEVLDTEVQYLYQYESVRMKLKQQQQLQRKSKFLETISFSTSKKARALKNLYEIYVNKDETEDRLTALDSLISKIDEFYVDYEWAEDIIELLNRERSMLDAGYEEKDLKILQMRIEDLLFNLLSSPEFNPLADKYTNKRCTLISIKKPGKIHRILSKSIEQPTKSGEFQSSDWLKNIGKISKNLTPYNRLLMLVRRQEKELTANSWTCWKLKVVDMYYLTDIIWNGRSIITESTDLNWLRMVRWDMYHEWSPWNCILLTEEEAVLHAEVNHFEEVYEEALIKKVKMKHLLAKMRFNKLYDLFIKRLLTGCEQCIQPNEHSIGQFFDLKTSLE